MIVSPIIGMLRSAPPLPAKNTRPFYKWRRSRRFWKRKPEKNAIIAPIAAVLIVATILISNVVKKNQEEAVRLESYNTAISMVEAGRYDEAIAIFSDLGDYKDSVQQIELAEIAILDEQNAKAYANATALMEDGQYKQAKDIFEKLGEYQDSQEMVVVLSELIESEAKEEDYQTALQLLSNNNYTNNSQVGRLLTNLGEYKDSVSILQSFDYLKQGNSANDVLVFNSSDCYEGTGFPSLEFYLGEQVSVDTKQSQDITVYRYENIGNVISCDYFNNDGFLFRYGFPLKSMINASGNFYQFVFFDDYGNALLTSVTSSSGKWYREVVIIYSENVQTFLDSNGLTLN